MWLEDHLASGQAANHGLSFSLAPLVKLTQSLTLYTSWRWRRSNVSSSSDYIMHAILCHAPLTANGGWHEPAGRVRHSTAVVEESLYLWAGYQDGTPSIHDSFQKRTFLSHVEVFHLQKGAWEQRTTSGTPPLGLNGYGCVALGNDLHYFGGYCSHDLCFHNSVHKLSTFSLQWTVLAATTTEGRGPMRKSHCGMVAFKDGKDDLLFVVGGKGPAPSSQQPGAQYEQGVPFTYTNEQHIFSLNKSE